MVKDILTKIEDGKILIVLKKEFYERDAVFSAAYKFTDKCAILIEPVDEFSVGVYFKAKSGKNDVDLEKVAEDYCNEVLDQQIRLDLEKRYGNIRKLTVQHAFSPISNLKDKIKIGD